MRQTIDSQNNPERFDKQLIKEIVKVHNSSFPGFFLTTLGESFLAKYYKSVANNNEGCLVVMIEDGKVAGFGAASMKSAGFNKKLILSNPISFGIEFLKLIATRPSAIVRLAKNFAKSGEAEDLQQYAELFSIGTASEMMNKGIGTEVLKTLEKILHSKGCNELSLTTDAEENEASLGFYTKNGYTKLYDFIAYPSRKMYRLIKKLA